MLFARSRPTVITCMAYGSSLWRHTTTTTLGTRCRSAGAVHPINYSLLFAVAFLLELAHSSDKTRAASFTVLAPKLCERSGQLFLLRSALLCSGNYSKPTSTYPALP